MTNTHPCIRLVCPLCPPVAYLVTQRLLPEEPRSRRLMTSDQDTKVVAEPQVQQVQEAKENSHLVSFTYTDTCFSLVWLFFFFTKCSCILIHLSYFQVNPQNDLKFFKCSKCVTCMQIWQMVQISLIILTLHTWKDIKVNFFFRLWNLLAV